MRIQRDYAYLPVESCHVALIKRERIGSGLQVDSDVPETMVRIAGVGRDPKGSGTRDIVECRDAVRIESCPGDNKSAKRIDALLADRIGCSALAATHPG